MLTAISQCRTSHNRSAPNSVYFRPSRHPAPQVPLHLPISIMSILPARTSFCLAWYSPATSGCGTQTTLIPARLPASTSDHAVFKHQTFMGQNGLHIRGRCRQVQRLQRHEIYIRCWLPSPLPHPWIITQDPPIRREEAK